jgi:hypothetical protein
MSSLEPETRRIWETVIAKGVGQTFTCPELKRSMNSPIAYKKFANKVSYLKTMGIVRAVNPQKYGRFTGEHTRFEVVDTSKRPRKDNSYTPPRSQAMVEKSISKDKAIAVIIKEVVQQINSLETQKKGLSEYSYAELVEELANRS